MKCPSCGYENSDDARYCGLCEKPFGSFVKEPSAPYGLAPSLKPSKEAVKTVKKILRSQSKGPNWFQRHLNWTWVLPQLFLYIAALVVGYSLIMSMAGALMSPLESSFMLPFSGLFVVAIILSLLSAAAIWGIGAWVLKRKDRSMWWLLIFLAPTPAGWLNVFLGFAALVAVWIVFLRLENRNLLEDVPVSSGLSAPSGSSGSSSSIQPGLAPPGLGYRADKYGP